MRQVGAGLLAGMLCLLLLASAGPASGSDHADPALHPPSSQDAGITGLFAFMEGDRLVIVMNIHRGLTAPPPYECEGFEYTVHFDLTSEVSYESPENLARYGGSVVDPTAIRTDAEIRVRLNSDASFADGYPIFQGFLGDSADIFKYSGVRDDPFIFPRFFGTNVIAMAASVPLSAFPAGQQDWVLWATTTEDGKQIDHVGRSNRTQLGRLDFLNTLAVQDQTAAISEELASGQSIQATLMHLMSHVPGLAALSGGFQYVLQVRHYDVVPDVIIFTTRRAPGFPNGRRLEDDVAGLTCAQGDCVLQELAFIEGHWPRQTVNDKPFLNDFPYLADPWPSRPTTETKDRCGLIFWTVILAVVAVVIARWRRRASIDETPWVRPYGG